MVIRPSLRDRLLLPPILVLRHLRWGRSSRLRRWRNSVRAEHARARSRSRRPVLLLLLLLGRVLLGVPSRRLAMRHLMRRMVRRIRRIRVRVRALVPLSRRRSTRHRTGMWRAVTRAACHWTRARAGREPLRGFPLRRRAGASRLGRAENLSRLAAVRRRRGRRAISLAGLHAARRRAERRRRRGR